MNAKVFLMVTFLILATSLANATIVDISVETDKDTYQQGEEIHIEVTAYNPGDTIVDLSFGSDLQASYLIDGIYDWEEGRSRLLGLTNVSIDPYDSVTWEFTHGITEMQEYALNIGVHTLVGEVLDGQLLSIGENQSPSIEFEVIPEPATFLLLGSGLFGIHRIKS